MYLLETFFKCTLQSFLVYMYLILSIVLVKKIVRKRHLSFLIVFSFSDIARLPFKFRVVSECQMVLVLSVILFMSCGCR